MERKKRLFTHLATRAGITKYILGKKPCRSNEDEEDDIWKAGTAVHSGGWTVTGDGGEPCLFRVHSKMKKKEVGPTRKWAYIHSLVITIVSSNNQGPVKRGRYNKTG